MSALKAQEPPSPDAAHNGRLDLGVCHACGEVLAAGRSALYEYIHDEHVSTVEVGADSPIELPARSWLIAAFHHVCYARTLERWGFPRGVVWAGRCRISGHSITAPRPLGECPACGVPVAMHPNIRD
jgi:hypothetical protein